MNIYDEPDGYSFSVSTTEFKVWDGSSSASSISSDDEPIFSKTKSVNKKKFKKCVEPEKLSFE
jgi:hypothetical protein